MATRTRVLIWLGAVALIAGAVVTLRATEDSPSNHTDSDNRPEPVQVDRYAANFVVLPAPGRRPDPPAKVDAVPAGPGMVRVSWAEGLPGGEPPAGAAGYEVRWRQGGEWRNRLVITPDVLLDGLADGRRMRVEVRSVDAFGQRSSPAWTLVTPETAEDGLATTMTGLFDEFTEPARVLDRWHVSGYRGCVDVVSERERGLPVELGCGADLAVLRARQPMTLTPPNATGEVGRVAVRTDTAGVGGELTVTLVPGPVDRAGVDTQRANESPTQDAALPGGSIRVGVDDSGVHVSAAPDVRSVSPAPLEVFPAPARGPGVSHLFEVVLTVSGIRVYQDGLPVAVSGFVPSWPSASMLVGLRGPDRRRSRVHVTAAGFTGPATRLPLVTEVPVNAGTQRVLEPSEQSPQLGIARTPLMAAAAARLVATIRVAGGMDPSAVVMQFGGMFVPARPVTPAPSGVDGAVVTVAADVPAEFLGAAGPDSITPFVLRAPGTNQQVRIVETYLEVTPVGGTAPPTLPLVSGHQPRGDLLPDIDAVLCNSAGEPLNASVVPPRGQVVLKIDLDARKNQWETGTVDGVQGFQVWLDGQLVASVPTRAGGPGLGGHHALSMTTGGLTRGSHVLEVREYAMDGAERPESAVLNFTIR